MNFPKPKIDRETAIRLWTEEHSGYAKEQVILNNLGMIGLVLKSLNLNVQDEDLFSTGLIGLIKAVNTFNPDRGYTFSAYATQVIRNEILQIYRKKRIIPSFYLDEPYDLGNGEFVDFSEMIADDRNFEEEAICNIQKERVFSILNEAEKEIICLRANGKSQYEIAKIRGISQAQISRIIKSACKKCKKEILEMRE